MESDKHLRLPKTELQAMEDDLRRQARRQGLQIDITVKDNGDGTVDISWTVSQGAPATSTAPAGETERREGATAATPLPETQPKKTSTAATSGSAPAPSTAPPSASAAAAPLRPASPRATAAPAPTSPTLVNPPEGWVLGTLSSQFETSGRGPGTVSSGKNDPGGVSYGSYQMSSREGTVGKFVSDPTFPWRDRFAGLTPGSEQFSAQWKALATEEPDAFFKAQHAFIERTHFDPLVQNIKSACDFDVTKHSHALQDAVWSTAVQFGPNTPVVTKAIEAVGGVDALPNDLDGDRRLIRAIYAERGRRSADGGLVYFPRVTDKDTQESLANRFVNEARDALAMLNPNV